MPLESSRTFTAVAPVPMLPVVVIGLAKAIVVAKAKAPAASRIRFMLFYSLGVNGQSCADALPGPDRKHLYHRNIRLS
jgi:hypothetical protein